MTNSYQKNILRVASILLSAQVPFTINNCHDGAQLCFPWCKGDVACHSYTFGSLDGFVETYRFPWDKGDTSMLTPRQAAAKIIEYYENSED